MSGLFLFQRQHYLAAIGWVAHIQTPPSGHPGCSRHETGPSTTFYPDPSTMPRISRKPQAVYLRFYFCPRRHGRGMPPKRSRWAGFVAGGPRGRPGGCREVGRRPRPAGGGVARGPDRASRAPRSRARPASSPRRRKFFPNCPCIAVRVPVYYFFARGRSSAGRALDWQSRGQGFDPPRLHPSIE